MSSDLDKLMEKLHKPKVEEVPQEIEEVEETEDFEDDLEDDEEEDDEVEDEILDQKPIPAQKPKEIPKKEEVKEKEPAQVEVPKEDDDQTSKIDAELGLLQNNGIFRRELLLTLKELVDVQKVNAEILLQLKKELKK